MTQEAQTEEQTSHSLIVGALTMDERDVILWACGQGRPTRPETLPKLWHRSSWDLIRRGILLDPYESPVPTDHARVFADLLVSPIPDDEADAWGILFRSKRELCWWKADSAGYHTDVRFAGLYSRDYALRQHGRTRGDGGRDEAIPPAKMLELVFQAIEKTSAELDGLQSQHDAILHAFAKDPE